MSRLKKSTVSRTLVLGDSVINYTPEEMNFIFKHLKRYVRTQTSIDRFPEFYIKTRKYGPLGGIERMVYDFCYKYDNYPLFLEDSITVLLDNCNHAIIFYAYTDESIKNIKMCQYRLLNTKLVSVLS